MDLYNEASIDSLNSELELKDSEFITIDAETDNIYFDGYANVYDCTVHVHNATDNTTKEYSASITHNALAYFHNGE